MLKQLTIGLLAIIFSIQSNAQQPALPVKFSQFVFDKVSIQKNILYKNNIPDGIKKKYYRFDWYEPEGDTTAYRPLIIWLHGGGFKFGKKTSAGTPVWSKTFARRGYACAAINYRLSKKHPLKNFADLVEGCADAIEDVEEAVAYFKQHYKQYRIDTNNIILAGNSAGGMIALQAVYSSPFEMAKLLHKADSVLPARYIHNPMHIAGIISCWGAVFDINWLQNNTVPIVCIHGQRDRVVPVNNQNPSLFGGQAIHRKADSLHIPNALKIFEGYGHELQKHFNPLFAGGKTKKRWLVAGSFIAGFLQESVLRKK